MTDQEIAALGPAFAGYLNCLLQKWGYSARGNRRGFRVSRGRGSLGELLAVGVVTPLSRRRPGP